MFLLKDNREAFMEKVLVYIYEGMADYEITLLTHLLGADCGKELVVISNNEKLIRSKSGILYKPHKTLQEIDIEEVEGLIIPGGWLESLDDQLISLIQRLNKEKKFLAAICAAPWIFAEAGVLRGSKYTTSIVEWQQKHIDFFGIADPFPREGYVDHRVVRDGNIITAKGSAFIDFAIEVCDYLELFKDENERQELEEELKGN